MTEVEQIRQVFAHPNPQNRSISNPYVGQEPGMALWFPDGVDHIASNLHREPLGLLSLSAINDGTAEPVTKADVTEYITNEINQRINELRSQGIVSTVIQAASLSQQSSVDLISTLPIPPHIKRMFSENLDGFNRLTAGNEAQGIAGVSINELAYLGQCNDKSLKLVLKYPDAIHAYMSRNVPFSMVSEIGQGRGRSRSMGALLRKSQEVVALMDGGTSFDDIRQISISDRDALQYVLEHRAGFERLRAGNAAQEIAPVTAEALAHLGKGNVASLKLVLEHPDAIHAYMSRGMPFSSISEIGHGRGRSGSLRALLSKSQEVMALMDGGTSFDDIRQISASAFSALESVLEHGTGFQRLRAGNAAQGIAPVPVEALAHLGKGNGASLGLVLQYPDAVHAYMSRGVPFSAISEIGHGPSSSMRALLSRPQKVTALMDGGTSFDDIRQISASAFDALENVLEHTTGFQRLRAGNTAQGIAPVTVEALARLGERNGASLGLVLEHPDAVHAYMSKGVPFSAISEVGRGPISSIRVLLSKSQKVMALMDSGISFDHIAQMAVSDHNNLNQTLDNIQTGSRSTRR